MAPLPIPSEITGERRRRISQTYTHLHNELDKDMEALRADYRRTHYFSARAIQGALKMVDEIEQGKRAVLHKLQQEEMDNHLTFKDNEAKAAKKAALHAKWWYPGGK